MDSYIMDGVITKYKRELIINYIEFITLKRRAFVSYFKIIVSTINIFHLQYILFINKCIY